VLAEFRRQPGVVVIDITDNVAERYGAVQNGLGSLSAMPGFSPAQPVTVVQPLRSAGRNSRSPGMLSRMW
jgi:hypothetical protein